MRGPLAFGPDRKLPDKPAFDRVFAEPDFRLRRHPFMLLARRRDAGPARLGLVVGKKHARRAVARNRIRRVAREQFRLILGPLGWTCASEPALASAPNEHSSRSAYISIGGVDIILMARPGAAEFDGAQLAEVLGWLFDRLLREALVIPQSASATSKQDAAAGNRTTAERKAP